MKRSKSYVHFSFTGEFDPDEITKEIGVSPTKKWFKGELTKYRKSGARYSLWEISTKIGVEYLDMNKLVSEIISKLKGKEDIILEIKEKFGAYSLLQIKMDIDINDEQSTPFIGHDNNTIEFLYKTKTETDIDIYRFNSAKKD